MLQPLALAAEPVLGGDPDLVQPGNAVLDAPQPHEGVAPLDRDPGRVGLDDEGADAPRPAVVVGHPGHDDKELGDDPVGRPQLHAVEEVCRAVLGGRRRAPDARGVGADVGLGEQERRDRPGGAPGQEAPLLVLGTDQLDRLGHADRLVRGQERAEAGADRPDEHEGLGVGRHRQAEASVVTGHLHAERPDLGQVGEVLVGDLRLPLDAPPVEPGEHPAQLDEELRTAALVLGVRARVRVDELEVEAPQIEPLGEARPGPVRLAGRLGDLARLALGDLPPVRAGESVVIAYPSSSVR